MIDRLAQLTPHRPEMQVACRSPTYLPVTLCTELIMHVVFFFFVLVFLAVFKKLMNHKLFNHGIHSSTESAVCAFSSALGQQMVSRHRR